MSGKQEWISHCQSMRSKCLFLTTLTTMGFGQVGFEIATMILLWIIFRNEVAVWLRQPRLQPPPTTHQIMRSSSCLIHQRERPGHQPRPQLPRAHRRSIVRLSSAQQGRATSTLPLKDPLAPYYVVVAQYRLHISHARQKRLAHQGFIPPQLPLVQAAINAYVSPRRLLPCQLHISRL